MKHLIHHIHKEVWHSHLFDYLLITIAAIFFILGIRLFSGQPGAQFVMVLAFSCFYIIWGTYHHIVTKTFRLRIMLEYVLIGFAIIMLMLTLMFPN